MFLSLENIKKFRLNIKPGDHVAVYCGEKAGFRPFLVTKISTMNIKGISTDIVHMIIPDKNYAAIVPKELCYPVTISIENKSAGQFA